MKNIFLLDNAVLAILVLIHTAAPYTRAGRRGMSFLFLVPLVFFLPISVSVFLTILFLFVFLVAVMLLFLFLFPFLLVLLFLLGVFPMMLRTSVFRFRAATFIC